MKEVTKDDIGRKVLIVRQEGVLVRLNEYLDGTCTVSFPDGRIGYLNRKEFDFSDEVKTVEVPAPAQYVRNNVTGEVGEVQDNLLRVHKCFDSYDVDSKHWYVQHCEFYDPPEDTCDCEKWKVVIEGGFVTWNHTMKYWEDSTKCYTKCPYCQKPLRENYE